MRFSGFRSARPEPLEPHLHHVPGFQHHAFAKAESIRPKEMHMQIARSPSALQT